MRGIPRVDASLIELGAATKPVRSMLTMLADIDWFVPPKTGSIASAVVTFDRCWSLLEPWTDGTMIPLRDLDLDVELGGLDRFRELCARVRMPRAYDWRYGAPKLAERIHGLAYGFDERELLRFAPPNIDARSSLLFAVNNSCIWKTVAPQLPLEPETNEGDTRDVRQWFVDNIGVDVVYGVRWQFVEPHASLGCNPFAALLECVARGGYPFVLAPDRALLFFFDR